MTNEFKEIITPKKAMKECVNELELVDLDITAREVHNAYLRGKSCAYEEVVKTLGEMEYFFGPAEIKAELDKLVMNFRIELES